MKTNYGEFRVLTLRETSPDSVGDNPQAVFEYYKNNIMTAPEYRAEQEQVHVILTNTRRRIIGHTMTAMGTLDAVTSHPRDIFRPAIIASAKAIILVHNHPSGLPDPSEADVQFTRRLIKAAEILQVEFSDHIVVGSGPEVLPQRPFVSLRAMGHFAY